MEEMLMRETHARRATDQYACRHVGTSVYVVYVSQYTEPESAYTPRGQMTDCSSFLLVLVRYGERDMTVLCC